MHHLPKSLSLCIILRMAVSFTGCGGPSVAGPDRGSASREDSDVQAEQIRWTAALLRKLDGALREQVRTGAPDRLPVKVFFQRIPEDDVLATLLLSRVGDLVVGQVDRRVLHDIAARTDVDRIEHLSDVGYAVE